MPRSTDPAKAARQDANLLAGASSDPDARERQLANLQHGRVTHGASSGKQLDAAREKHERELREDYPLLDRRRRALLADRLARIEMASAFVQERGIGPRGKRAGNAFPIADRLESWSRRAEDMLAEAEAQHAEGNESPASLESIAAELAEADGEEQSNHGEPGAAAEHAVVEA